MFGFKQYAVWLVWVLFLLVLQGCETDILNDLSVLQNEAKKPTTPETLNPAEEYFLEVGLGAEFGGAEPVLRKWSTDVRIFVPNRQYPHLNEELERILKELNDLSESIVLYEVAAEEEANFVVFLGDKDTYVSKYEPNAANYVNGNLGLFWVYWTSSQRIVKGSMYVDVFRVSDSECQKHLLREEITQGLGLMNDSFEYDNSIFYQKWTCGADYAPVDREVIRYILHPQLKAGMNREEVEEVLLRID